MATLKMVNGKTYIDARVNNGDPVTLGMQIEVDDPKVVKDILSLRFTDRKDNERPYFRDVSAPEVVDEVDEEVVEVVDEADTTAAGDETPRKPRRSRNT